MNRKRQWLFETPFVLGGDRYTHSYTMTEYYSSSEGEAEWEKLTPRQPIDHRIDMEPLHISSHFPLRGMGGKLVRSGNQVDFFIDGPKTFEAMVRAIKTATGKQHYIYLLGWWLTDCFPLIKGDPNSTIAKLFAEASRKGVQIRVMLWD